MKKKCEENSWWNIYYGTYGVPFPIENAGRQDFTRKIARPSINKDVRNRKTMWGTRLLRDTLSLKEKYPDYVRNPDYGSGFIIRTIWSMMGWRLTKTYHILMQQFFHRYGLYFCTQGPQYFWRCQYGKPQKKSSFVSGQATMALAPRPFASD